MKMIVSKNSMLTTVEKTLSNNPHKIIILNFETNI